MSYKHKLIISVSAENFQKEEDSDFLWSNAIDSAIHPELSRALFDDDYVVPILKKAFENGLTRRNSWNLNSISQEKVNSFVKAARVFKRGVAVYGAEAQSFENKKNSVRQYIVEQVDSLFDCFSQLHSDDVVIVDENVEKFWWHRLPAGYVSFAFSEAMKNLETCSALKKVIKSKISESSKVFVVGGGVAGDVTGFVCGLLGIEVGFIPTTLLSMVDSSIGGKVGVNFEPWGKNQIGLFYPPVNVRIWSGWLSTLDQTEFLSGMSEAIKHAIIVNDCRLLQELIVVANTFTNTASSAKMNDLILDVLAIKAAVVERDPFECGERAILNFGHTLGHVLETLALHKGIHVTHGACVAVGMVHALLLSQRKFSGDFSKLIDAIKNSAVIMEGPVLQKLFGEQSCLQSQKTEILQLLLSDKKSVERQQISYVLPNANGEFTANFHGEWTVNIALEEAWQAIEDTWALIR